ncbi:MAG: discoidin domain-containing protein, partial [Bacteroidaceae bacterium]|nr:discoidin domain-containing protein [Bacteroidaceae bacterium]
MEFKAAVDEIFGTDFTAGASAVADNVRGGSRRFAASNILDNDYDSYWAVDDGVLAPQVTISLDGPKTFNCVMIQEYIHLGQRITGFDIEALGTDGAWRTIARETTVGYKRLVPVPVTEALAIRINITGSLACPVINKVGLYMDTISGIGPELAADASCTCGDSCDAEIVPASQTLTLDLGETVAAVGFFYAPAEKGKGGCVITYNLEVSADGKSWTTVFSDRMF